MLTPLTLYAVKTTYRLRACWANMAVLPIYADRNNFSTFTNQMPSRPCLTVQKTQHAYFSNAHHTRYGVCTLTIQKTEGFYDTILDERVVDDLCAL